MQAADIEDLVREWLDRASVDPELGVPPDVRSPIDVDKLTTYGRIQPGEDEPVGGFDHWTITVHLYFREDESWGGPLDQRPDVADLVARLEASLRVEPWLGDRDLLLGWREVGPASDRPRRLAPEGYPAGVELRLHGESSASDS